MPPQKLSQKKKALFSFIAVCLSLFAAFIIIEIAVRVILYRQGEFIDTLKVEHGRGQHTNLNLFDIIIMSDNKDQVYKMIPDATGTFIGAHLKLNSFGFRDKEWSVEKPEDTFRIAVLGDSVAFGWGVETSERFSEFLELDLNTSSPLKDQKFEVMNFSVPGYNTVMQAATLEDQVLPFQPDLILLSLTDNDAELPGFVRQKAQVLSFSRSFIYETIRDQIKGLKFADTARRVKGGVAQDIIAQVDAPSDGADKNPEFAHLLGPDNLRSALVKIGKSGIPVLVFAYENILDENGGLVVVPNPFTELVRQTEMPVFSATSEILAYLRKNRLKAVDGWILPTDLHPNKTLHKILADRAAEEIRNHLNQ